ncbi:DUF5695 domain-containing protein [Silvibacterium acidisoli]|uniref:DUF5695 domain-containing protein n=1 Tax=Acidobacteriaceae bacterium ZG23-2 TaxID=2883246 RepID=UPI00406C7A4D
MSDSIAELSRRAFLKGPVMGGAALALASRKNALAMVSGGGSPFVLTSANGVLTSLRFAGDAFPTDYIANGEALGTIVIAWRRTGGAWQKLDSKTLAAAQVKVLEAAGGGCAAEYRASDEHGDALSMTVRMEPHDKVLRWSIALRNLSAEQIEVGDVALPLPMHSTFKGDEPPTGSVLKHSFVSGHGSFLFWMRSNSVGPYLVMTPERDTALEYWDRTPHEKDKPPVYRAYVHSAAAGEAVAAAGGRWRQPHTSLPLAAGAQREYAFQLGWAQDYEGVRERLIDADLIDVEIAPGMTVPSDLFTCIALRSREHVVQIEAEHPQETTIEPVGAKNGYSLYRVRFSRLGENMLTLHQAGGRTTRLEFFSTEPLETLIHKRAAFIAKHQVRDTSKWFNGLLCEWAMDTQVQLSPENYDRIRSWRVYEVTCDDPGLSKPAYLASKNAEFPLQAEVTAMDDYIEHFVWGGLQRTTEESDSYGIYGILDWKQNRDSSDPGPKGKRHYWRAYDYSHIVVMYFGIYRVARDFPGIHTRLSRDTYLDRAYGTAIAFFTVPWRVVEWSAYQTGYYNEVILLQLMEELDAVGRHEDAAELRQHWEKKVRFFVNGGPNLFGSEYAFDSTGFESTQALARYALDHPEMEGVTPAEAKKFSSIQIRANLFCRGVLEKAYYYYGSDYRGEGGDAFTLTYMSQMGGWGVLNHALYDRTEAEASVRLGYASYLSAWALMNTGTKESGFGYWFPSEANDGGSGGGFEPAARGMTWLGQPHHRGPWYYSSESDLGFTGALRTAATIVADDPIFGTFCFGGEMKAERGTMHIVPRDGVRRRFHARTGEHKLDMQVTGARFAKEKPIQWSAGVPKIAFTLETETAGTGSATVIVRGLPPHDYRLVCGEQSIAFRPDGDKPQELSLRISPGVQAVEISPAS